MASTFNNKVQWDFDVPLIKCLLMCGEANDGHWSWNPPSPPFLKEFESQGKPLYTCQRVVLLGETALR